MCNEDPVTEENENATGPGRLSLTYKQKERPIGILLMPEPVEHYQRPDKDDSLKEESMSSAYPDSLNYEEEDIEGPLIDLAKKQLLEKAQRYLDNANFSSGSSSDEEEPGEVTVKAVRYIKTEKVELEDDVY